MLEKMVHGEARLLYDPEQNMTPPLPCYLATSPPPPTPVQVDPERGVRGDQRVDAQVKLLAAHEIWPVDVPLGEVRLRSLLALIGAPGVIPPPVADLEGKGGWTGRQAGGKLGTVAGEGVTR